jgi:hypothetical protein
MTQQLTATGGTPPYTWTAVSTLPAGITLSSGGLLSGTPSAVASGSYTVRLTDSVGATTTADVWIDAIALAPAIPPVIEQMDFSVSIIAEVEMSGSDLAVAPLVLAIVPEVEFQLATLNVIKGRVVARGTVQPQGLAAGRAAARGSVQPQGLVVGRAAARGFVVGESVNPPAIGRVVARGSVQPQGLAVGRAVARGYVEQVSPYLAETNAWRARVQAKGTDVSTVGLNAIDAFVRELVAGGIDSKFKLLHFYAGINAFGGLLCPYRHPTNADATLTNFDGSNYTASGSTCGLQGTTYSLVNHNYSISTYHSGFNFSMGAFVRGAGSNSSYGSIMGTADVGSRSCGIQWRNDGVARFHAFEYFPTGVDLRSFSSSPADLLLVGSSVSSSDLKLYTDSTQVASITATRTLDSTGLGSLRSFDWPTYSGQSNRRFVLSFAGDGLTAGEVSTLNTAVQTLISSLSV